MSARRSATGAAGRAREARGAQGERAGGKVIAIAGARSSLGAGVIGALERSPAISKIVALDAIEQVRGAHKTRSIGIDLESGEEAAGLAEILRAERVDAVVHLAIAAFAVGRERDRRGRRSDDVAATIRLVEGCRAAGVPKIVAASSTLLYGPYRSNPNFLRESAPLRGLEGCASLAAAVEIEARLARFADEASASVALTVLRLAPVLGPTVKSWLTRWLSGRVVPTMMGFNPLVQLLHERDAVAAVIAALEADAHGAFNVAGGGVLPVSAIVRLAGGTALPVPRSILRRAAGALFFAGLSEVPPQFVELLHHVCVADARRARSELGFVAAHTTREAAMELGGVRRHRDTRAVHEVTA